jgi:hypothetical protein
MSTVERLRDAIRHSGTPLVASLGEATPDEDARELALLAAGGPRVAAHREEVEIAVAAVDEGYRLHYGDPRALQIDDADLALLAGDRMYALGLARLAAIGALTAIAELADIIALSAQAHTAGDAELALAAWQAGAVSIGWGADAATAAAKELARAGDPGAVDALRAAAARAGL